MNNSKKFDVFLSYNWSSKSLASSLFQKLTQDFGLKIWMDDLELDNRMLYEQLCDGIINSKCFLCCITKKYTESDNCIKEINFACLNKTPLVIAMLEDLNISETKSVGFIIAPLTRFNFYYEKDMSRLWSGNSFDSMVKSIQSIVSINSKNIHITEGSESFNRNECAFPNGDKYIGSFLDGKLNGYGVYIYTKDNERYEGHFINNQKCGLGTYYYASGDIYEGYWQVLVYIFFFS